MVSLKISEAFPWATSRHAWWRCLNALFLDLIGRDWEVVGDKIVEMLYAVLKTENIPYWKVNVGICKLTKALHDAQVIGDDRNRIKNRNSGTLPEFRFRLIRNRNDFSKFRFRLIRNRIEDLKFRFWLIRTGVRQKKSGEKDKQMNLPVCAYTAVINNIRFVCISCILYMLILNVCIFVSGAHNHRQG